MSGSVWTMRVSRFMEDLTSLITLNKGPGRRCPTTATRVRPAQIRTLDAPRPEGTRDGGAISPAPEAGATRAPGKRGLSAFIIRRATGAVNHGPREPGPLRHAPCPLRDRRWPAAP